MKQDMEFLFKLKAFEKCSTEEISDFVNLVLEGGEIEEVGFNNRIKENSKLLGFVWQNNELASVAAIKTPLRSYHRRVFRKAGVSDIISEYPLEYGWAYTTKGCRRKGLASKLAKLLINSFPDTNIYATAAISNKGSHRLLEKSGFIKIGDPYIGRKRTIQLFIKNRE